MVHLDFCFGQGPTWTVFLEHSAVHLLTWFGVGFSKGTSRSAIFLLHGTSCFSYRQQWWSVQQLGKVQHLSLQFHLVKLLFRVDVPGVALLAWNHGTMWSRVFFGSTFHCIISLRTGPAGTPVSVRSGARTFDLVVHDTSGISCHCLPCNNFVDSLLQSWTRTWLTLQPKTGAAETCEAEPSQRSGFPFIAVISCFTTFRWEFHIVALIH